MEDAELIISSETLLNENVISKEISLIKSPWHANPYLKAATSDNTRKAYKSDVRHYEMWGGNLPATTESIINYLQAYASKLNPRTLARRLIALRHWHDYQQFPDPTNHPAIAKMLTGILRIHGQPKNKARALTPDELESIAAFLHNDHSLTALRDNALLQIGFFGALRRSELVAIRFEDIQWEKQGIVILLPSSKTDQTHEGQTSVIPYGNNTLCPISALQAWLNISNLNNGPIFRRISAKNYLGHHQLTPLSINQILKKRATQAGIAHADEFSSHSLRRGLATSAAKAGAPLHAIMRAGRWKQTNTVMEYIEAQESFSENAAANVLKKLEK